jgi:Organic radical activating enzymes
MVNYYSSAFPVYTSTDGIAYEIYLSGCNNPNSCVGCFAEHTYDYNAGLPLTDKQIDLIAKDIKSKSKFIDNIVILGGEPLVHDKFELLYFLHRLHDKIYAKGFKYCLWLYTSYELDDIDNEIKLTFDFIKCGKYIDNDCKNFYIKEFGVTLASQNQYIYDVNNFKKYIGIKNYLGVKNEINKK